MSVEEVSNQAWFVLLAYLAAFMPWTFLASKDFIGPRWKTVRDTHVSGRNHAIFTFVSACFVVAYIVVQGLSNDYKEMSAALVAFAFSLLNFLRTLWGLWQLRCFRKWAINSINALEAMGVRYEINKTRKNGMWEEAAGAEDKQSYASDTMTESEEDFDSSKKNEVLYNAATLADGLLVNETIVDNQLTHGEARCFLKYGDIELKRGPRLCASLRGADNEAPEVKCVRGVWQRLRIVINLLCEFLCGVWQWLLIVISLFYDCGMNVIGKKSPPQVYMVPFKPVDVWLNWSVAFAAQGLGQWIKDFSSPNDPRDDPKYDELTAKERWEQRAQYFGSQLVSSAWLQLWPEIGPAEGWPTTSPLHWSTVWDQKSRMNDGVVTKDELLRKAMKSGRALPFAAPHDKINNEHGRSVYHAYQRKFDQIVKDVPVQLEFDKMIEEFDIEKLEWLTVLLYIGTIAREKGRNLSGGVNDRASPTEPRESVSLTNGEEMKVSQALTNLKTQVYSSRSSSSTDGRDSELQGMSEMFNCMSVGIPQRSEVFLSTENRHVSKVGEMIDVWMSLVCGDQIGFMMRLNESDFWEEVCFCENMSSLIGEGSGSYSCDDSKAIQAVHAEVEKRRIFYNFVNDANWLESCDQFLTFMGYRMETVRSRLGDWVVRNRSGHRSEEEFCPLIEGVKDVSVELGQELSQVLVGDLTISNWGRRGVQTRFLWEIHQELAKDEEVGPGSAKLMCLCILSFPSVCIEVENGGMEDVTCERENGCVCVNVWGCCKGEALSDTPRDGSCGLPQMRMRMYATGGPQGIDVIGTFSKQEKTVSVKLQLRVSEEVKRFEWVLWRDAFLGRLKGLKEWQEEHGIHSTNLQLTEGEMKVGVEMLDTSAGEKVVCWPGWKPFRFEIMRFELETEGLLKERFEKEREDAKHVFESFIGLENEKWKDCEGQLLAWQGTIVLYSSLGSITRMQVQPVAYGAASAAVLRHALLVVGEAFDDAETGTRGTVDIDRSKALLENAKNCASEDRERAVSLLEIAATVYGNEEALGECVNVLMQRSVNKENSGRRVVCLLEGFLARIYSDRRRSCVNLLLSKCLEVMEWVGDESLITHRLSILFAHIWTINPNSFREKSLAALQNMYSMQQGVSVTEVLSLMLYDDFSCGKIERRWRGSNEVFVEGRNTMKVTLEAFRRGLTLDTLRVCKWFNENVVEILNGSERDSGSERYRRQARLRISTLKAWDNGSTFEDYEEAAALYREMTEDGNFFDTIVAMSSWATVLIEGQGCCAQDEVEVTKMCDFSIEHGHDAIVWLARALELRKDKAICMRKPEELYRRAIEGGDVDAMKNLALLLDKGAEGVERNVEEAAELYRRAIDGGSIDAMNNLADLLEKGAEGVERNTKEAEQLYRRAIEGGDVDAMNNLADLLEKGAEGVERNVEEAEQLYRRAIDGGNIVAMNNLAFLLEKGSEGVERNMEEAEQLYRRAVDGGYVTAMSNLADLLEKGAEGVERNTKEAEQLYRRAIDGGYVSAMNNLADLLEKGAEGVERNTKEAEQLYRRAIDGGNIVAMNNLADLLEKGAEGVERNVEEAEQLYRRAIDGGNIVAMSNLAFLLEEGSEGVERNMEEAEQLYRRAVDGGYVTAMSNLADLLEKGAEGVERNTKEAEQLYRRAVDGGYVTAMSNLAFLLEKGAEGVERNTKEAEQLYRRAIDGGNIVAMNNLADLLEKGAEGVERNTKEAEQLYRRAIDGGNIVAMNNLADLLEEGAEGVERNAEEAEQLYRRAVDGGYVTAMSNLAFLLEKGAEGVEQNTEEAVELYRRASEGGDVDAMFNLAFLLEKGAEGVEQNAEEAEQLYRRAANRGDVDAMKKLASGLDVEGVEQNVN